MQRVAVRGAAARRVGTPDAAARFYEEGEKTQFFERVFQAAGNAGEHRVEQTAEAGEGKLQLAQPVGVIVVDEFGEDGAAANAKITPRVSGYCRQLLLHNRILKDLHF